MNDFRYYQTNELSHHGIQGMHWGQRNGPPYPLQTFQRKVGDAVAKGKKALASATTAAGKTIVKVYNTQAEKTKARIAEERARKKAEAEDLAKRQAEAAKRAKLIKMAKEHPELLSSQELMDLNNRARQESSLKDNYNPKKKGSETVNQSKNALISEVIKPGVVALGKAAVVAAITGKDFKNIATDEIGKVYNGKQQNNNNNNSNKDEKKKKFSGFEFKIKRE